MKTKASVSRQADPLSNVRRYGSQSELRPSERTLLDAVVDHGGVTAAARALGLSGKSTGNRMAVIREKLGVATTAKAVERWRERRVGG